MEMFCRVSGVNGTDDFKIRNANFPAHLFSRIYLFISESERASEQGEGRRERGGRLPTEPGD